MIAKVNLTLNNQIYCRPNQECKLVGNDGKYKIVEAINDDKPIKFKIANDLMDRYFR